MESASTRAFLDWIIHQSAGNNEISLFAGFKAWQFGKSITSIVSKGDFGIFESVALLPSNAVELIQDNSNENKNIEKLYQYFCCEVSKVALIPYPEGVRWLEYVWKNIVVMARKNLITTTNWCFDIPFPCRGVKWFTFSAINMDMSHRFTVLSTKLQLLPISIFEGMNKTASVAIHFSEKVFSKPFNRFSHHFGANNFTRVQFQFPHIKLNDLLEVAPLHPPPNSSTITVQREILNRVANSWTNPNQHHLEGPSLEGPGLEGDDLLWQKERLLKYNQVNHFVNKFLGSELKFLNKKWNLISCNITGALKFTYTYTSLDRANVADWVFRDTTSVIDPKKMMLPALRMGLVNSTCVESCRLDNFWTVSVVKDIATMVAGKPVALNDGCGWISKQAAQLIFKDYCKNWFGAGENGNAEHRAAVLQETFTALGSPESHAKWASDDLAPADHFPENYCPSAFQIRYRGFKGMLVVDTALEGKVINFSESMLKFQSTLDECLFIVGLSRPAPLTVLSSELIGMFEGCSSQGKQHSLFGYLIENLISRRMDNNGEHLVNLMRNPEHFLQFLEIDSNEAHFSQLPVFASRILGLNVPLPRSAHVYGIADFSRTLKPNQVFLRVSRHCGPTTGSKILVTKTPALRREDMRVFEVISDVPNLNHLADVVVFSTNSRVLTTKQLANADLDGDHYYLFWDPALLDLLDLVPLAEVEEIEIQPIVPNNAQLVDLGAPKQLGGNSVQFSTAFSHVVTSLRQPANSFDYCSLQHLLCLRRVFMDEAGASWPDNDIVRWISNWTINTFEAPKHGEWVKWDTVRLQLGDAPIPEFPHYYLDSSFDTRQRQSTSLCAKLSMQLWSYLLHPTNWDPQSNAPSALNEFEWNGGVYSENVMRLDCAVRSSGYATPYGVHNLEDIFGGAENPSMWFDEDEPSGVPHDPAVLFKVLSLTAPLHYAFAKCNKYEFARQINVPADLQKQMLFEQEFDFALENIVVTMSNIEADDEANYLHPWKFVTQSLVTPSCFGNDGLFKYVHLFRFLVNLSSDHSQWTNAQVRAIRLYLFMKSNVLKYFQSHIRKSGPKLLKDAATKLNELNLARKGFCTTIQNNLNGMDDLSQDDTLAHAAMLDIDTNIFSVQV